MNVLEDNMGWLNLVLIVTPPLLLFGIGYLIRFRKMYWLISGYNTMSAAKKQKVDTEKLGVLMGNMCFIMGTLMFTGIMLIVLGQAAIGFIVMSGLVPVIIYILIAAQKYDGNNFDETGKMKTSTKFAIGAILAGLLVILSFVSYMVIQGFQPSAVTFDQTTLTISGSYGQSISLQDIQSLELLEQLPVIELRTNGSAIGERLRGHFRLRDVGQVMLYLKVGVPPYIVIKTAAQPIYLNLETAEQTQDLYNQIDTAWRGAQ